MLKLFVNVLRGVWPRVSTGVLKKNEFFILNYMFLIILKINFKNIYIILIYFKIKNTILNNFYVKNF